MENGTRPLFIGHYEIFYEDGSSAISPLSVVGQDIDTELVNQLVHESLQNGKYVTNVRMQQFGTYLPFGDDKIIVQTLDIKGKEVKTDVVTKEE